MASWALAREAGRVLEEKGAAADFQIVYRRTWPDVFRYAFVLTRNREDAEDVAAETFRRALEAVGSDRGPVGDYLPWLFTIARRLTIDRQRRRRLVVWLPFEGSTEQADEAQEASFLRSEIWLWFDQLCHVLPAEQREALFLRFQFDLSDRDAARVMGTSVGNVRTRVSRGLATLRQHPEVMEG